MTTSLSSRPEHAADVLFTWRVVTARAAAADELTLATPPAPMNFLRLAAADEAVSLTGAPWHDSSGGCRAEARVREDRLYLALQAEGFAGLEQLGTQRRWLVSHDGKIRVLCAFDADGGAEIVLRDSPDVQRSLRDFSLHAVAEAGAD